MAHSLKRSHLLILFAVVAGASLVSFFAGRYSTQFQDIGQSAEGSLETQGAHFTTSQSSVDGRGSSSTAGHAPTVEISNFLDHSVERTFEDFNQAFIAMTSSQISALFVELRKDGWHPQQALMERILIFHLIGKEPKAMLDLKLTYPDLPVLMSSYKAWAEIDPEAALAHNFEIKNETWHRQGLDAIFAGMAVTQPKLALETLISNSKSNRSHYRNLFSQWSERAPADAAAAIKDVPSQFRNQALRAVGDNWPETDPVAALYWIENLKPDLAKIARPAFEARMRQLENK